MSQMNAGLSKQLTPDYKGPQEFESPNTGGPKPVHVRKPDAFDKICDAFFGFFEKIPDRVKSAVSQLTRALGGEATAQIMKHIKENASGSKPSSPGGLGGASKTSPPAAQWKSVRLAVATATVAFMKIAYPERAAAIDQGLVNLDAEEPDYENAGKALEEVFLYGATDGEFAQAVNDAVAARNEKGIEGDSRDSIARQMLNNFPQALKEKLAHNHAELGQYTGPNGDVPKNFAQCLGEAGRTLFAQGTIS